MMWNELSFDFQKVIISKIIILLDDEQDEVIRHGYLAAISELEVWGHMPEEHIPYVAEAMDY